MAAEENILTFMLTALHSPLVYISMLVVLLVLIIFTLISKRNVTIKIFGKKILDVEENDMDKPKDDKDKKKDKDGNVVENIPKHAMCNSVNDFILVITETTNVVSEISEIKFKGCISEQMSRADQHLLRIRAILQNCYRDRVAKLNDPTVDAVGSYKFYQSLTYIMASDVKDQVIRSSFLLNHLAEKIDDVEYNDYINKCYINIKNICDDIINDMYFGDYALSQNDVLKIHDDEDIQDQLKKIVKDVYIDARDIAIRKRSRIEELQKGLKDFVKKIVGING